MADLEQITFASVVGTPRKLDGLHWVQITPAGEVRARDGRVFHVHDMADIVAASKNWHGKTDIVVDYEHQTHKASKNGQPAPAAGWIKKLEVREGGIWGQVEWTDAARTMIQARQYRYISPVLSVNKSTGRVGFVVAASLTNQPALDMIALAETQHGGRKMEDHLDVVRKALDLSEAATVEDVIQAIVTVRNSAERSKADDGATEALEHMAVELVKERREIAAARQMNKVETALAAGVFQPALKDWALQLCSADEARFDAFVERSGTPLAHLMRPAITDEAHKRFKANDDDEDRGSVAEAVAKNLGIDVKKLAS